MEEARRDSGTEWRESVCKNRLEEQILVNLLFLERFRICKKIDLLANTKWKRLGQMAF